ncbi:MAG: TonB-dependent receptor [Rhodocyclaceae bacterium]|nr:TonB-dependent receptor [Rhodocyclaceae bacterium]
MKLPTATLLSILSASTLAQQAASDTEKTSTVLPEVKVSADRQLLPASEVSNPVRIIDRKAIDALPVKDVTEALAILPNVNIRRSGGPDGEPSIGMYGISAQPRSSTSTTLAINGVPLNNGFFPEASLNILPLSLIQRAEVIQGPASSAYGNNARLGVVNLVTRRQSEFGGQVSASVGRWNTNGLGGYLGGAFKDGGNYLVGFDQRETDGHLQPRGRTDFSNSRLQNFAGFVDKAFGDLHLSAALIDYSWDRTNPSYLVQPGTPALTNPIGTPTARAENGSRQHFHVTALYQFNPEWSGDLTYNFNSFDERTTFNANYGTPSGAGQTTPTDQRTTSNSISAKLNWDTGKNLLTFGTEYQKGRLDDRVANTSREGDTTGFFIQNRYLAFDRQLSLSGGYRQDTFSYYNETSRSPKLGFVWSPTGANWRIRGNVSRAFSAPSFNQLFGSFGNTKLIATNLTVHELGFEIQPLTNLKLGATVFKTKTTNPIFPRPRNQNPICTPGPGNCFVNVGDVVETSGFTLDFRHQISSGWQWGGSWTRLDPEQNTFATSEHVIKLDTSYSANQWTTSATLRRETDRYFQDGFRSPFPNFTVVDASVSYRFDKAFTMSAIVENLTNQEYATTQIVSTSTSFEALPIFRPGRFLTLRGTYSF